ncbi:MAG: hypothetical protein K9N46_04115 [Candidatus Marinimicrobia bacterium]|nr:hypothetical protein [Candidatus Neomarinimicrobiota bacterium]MCF7828948.1 hypothetical protein [Candidatus Neomarinimicrobiota bacterium]MCF7879908.1 hypothetical protein [Candidatus Neomarinimicrobiota bacterium]
MTNQCSEFREKYVRCWDDDGNLQAFLTEATHPENCSDCRQFLSEFGELDALMNSVPESKTPNFGTMRVNVWDEIERRTARPGWREWGLRDAVVIPAIIAILAVSLYWLWPRNGVEQLSNTDTLYSYVLDELAPNELPEEVVHIIAKQEMGEVAGEYLLENDDYEIINEVYQSRDGWDEVLADLTETEL